MPTIQNKWIQKERKKREAETAAAYASDKSDSYSIVSLKKPVKRFSLPSYTTMARTLRGVRK